jgi:DNA-directed RNA polymerase I and III subunit RPAC1
VYSSDLKWEPKGAQTDRYKGKDPPKPYHDDIIIAKLRPGQVIHLEAHCNRGIGKDHAKFSPVCTASYRLMPKVEILEDVYDDRAELLMELERGVFELVNTSDGRKKVQIKNAANSTMSRNYLSEDDLAKSIKISRIPDHFIFSVETVGAIAPEDLLPRALLILVGKCNDVLDGVESL